MSSLDIPSGNKGTQDEARPEDKTNNGSSGCNDLASISSASKPQNNYHQEISSLIASQAHDRSPTTLNYSLAPPLNANLPGTITDFYLRCMPTEKANHIDKSTQTLPLNDNDTLFLSVLDENTVGKTKKIIYVDGQNVLSVNSASNIKIEVRGSENIHQAEPRFHDICLPVQLSLDDRAHRSSNDLRRSSIHNSTQYLPQRIHIGSSERSNADLTDLPNLIANSRLDHKYHQMRTSDEVHNETSLQNTINHRILFNQINHGGSARPEFSQSGENARENVLLFPQEIKIEPITPNTNYNTGEFQYANRLTMGHTLADGQASQFTTTPGLISSNNPTPSNEIHFNFSDSSSYTQSSGEFSATQMRSKSVERRPEFSQAETQTYSDTFIDKNNQQIPEPNHLGEGSSSLTASKVPKGGKMFSCGKCPLSFRRNHDLKRHSRSHLPVRPYDCEICMKSFSRKDALKRHRAANACKRFLRDPNIGQKDVKEASNKETSQLDSNSTMLIANTAELRYKDKDTAENCE